MLFALKAEADSQSAFRLKQQANARARWEKGTAKGRGPAVSSGKRAWAVEHWARVYQEMPGQLRAWLVEERRRHGLQKYGADRALAAFWDLRRLASFRNGSANYQGRMLFAYLGRRRPTDKHLREARTILAQVAAG